MPKDLRAFLDADDPPVYMTFGSCTQFDLEATTRLFMEAASLSGQRAIVQSDWDNVSAAYKNPDVYRVKRIPHEHVFPHCSMVVHHGGAGTTQASLRSGNPSLVVAHAFDQTYWGQRLRHIGVAGKLLHKRSITAGKLARGINTIIESPQMKQRAQKIGEAMRKEDGVGRAVALIEERFQ